MGQAVHDHAYANGYTIKRNRGHGVDLNRILVLSLGWVQITIEKEQTWLWFGNDAAYKEPMVIKWEQYVTIGTV